MRRPDAPLFGRGDLSEFLRERTRKLVREVDSRPADQVLGRSLEAQAAELAEKYRLDPPRLQAEQVEIDSKEAGIDVSREIDRHVPRGQTAIVAGIEVGFHIPFTGDRELFDYLTSHLKRGRPRASVGYGEIVLTFATARHEEGDRMRAEFDAQVGQIVEHLDGVRRQVEAFNGEIEATAKQRLERRRAKLQSDEGLVAGLGFPLRRRTNMPPAFELPSVRRKLAPRTARAARPGSTAPFKPEPVLDLAEYEHILSVCSGMVRVMECSPGAFGTLGEEDLRSHFLVQLNGHYEGDATAETFNFGGKTDILIRVEGRPIFIAECKLWDGPKKLIDAVDQLLGYVSWRDTKTALFVFNRRRDFTKVLGKIDAAVREHPNFLRAVEYASESGFRYALHHGDDRERELILTVLAFEVPTPEIR